MLKKKQAFIISVHKKLGRFLLLLAVMTGIVAALSFSALRFWILPDIEKYHNDVTQLASRALGLPVVIGKIEADWQGIRPHLLFSDVRLLDPQGGNALVLKRVDNVVSWMTLLTGELRLHRLEIDSPDLLVRRDKQGYVHVAGLQLAESSGDGKLSDWLLHQSSLIVKDGRISWQDDLYDRPLLVLSHAQFYLKNSGRNHDFELSITPPSHLSAPVTVRGDMKGKSFSERRGWSGEMFAQLDAADISAWSPWITLPEVLRHAQGGLRAWIDVAAGQFSNVNVDLKLTAVQSRLGADLPALNLVELQGRIGARILDRGFEISTQQLYLQMLDGIKLRPTDFSLRLLGKEGSRFSAGEITANAINFSDLTALAEYIPLGQEFKQKLADYAPRGHVSDLHAKWNGENKKHVQFDINARFDGLSLHQVEAFPGIENLSGRVNGNDNSGLLSLNSPGIQLNAPQLFLGPLSFDTFVAQASWQRMAVGWDVKLNNFSASNADVDGTAYGSYQTDEQGPGIADISLNLTRASVSQVPRYLPKNLLGNKTMAWLQTGLQAGEADEAHLHLRGNLNDFPFPGNKKGLFKVEAKAKGVVIDYAKHWPRVEDAEASLLIEGHNLQVDSTSAKLAGASAQRVTVSIPDLLSAEPVVQILGEASDQTRKILNFVKRSPVSGYVNGFTDEARASGKGKLDLQLDIPLGESPIKLQGSYHFFNNHISFGELIPLARRLTGDLAFTESSLQTKNIRAQILGGPAKITAYTEADGALKVNMLGNANMDVWHRVNHEPMLQSLTGSAKWTAEVSAQGKQFAVVVSSDLLGIDSRLPVPLSKDKGKAIPVKYELRSASDSQDVTWLRYGNLLSARILRSEDENGTRFIKRAYVNFGPARRMIDRDGIWIGGVLPELELEGWTGIPEVFSGKNYTRPQIDGMDMSISKLTGYGSAVAGVSIHARNRKGIIKAKLTSNNLKGELNWFPKVEGKGNGKLIVRLKKAVLSKLNKDIRAIKPAENAKLNNAKPIHVMPVIDAVVDDFTYHGNALGKLEFHISQFEKDILLNHFNLSNSDGTLQVNGKWGASPSQTHLIAKLKLNNVGNVLGRSGYPNSIKNGNGTLDCDLVWPGAPSAFTLAALSGQMNLKMKKGQFLKLDPGAGKLLSVLSLQSLPKRITLDFTDVFSQGFEFDDIDGDAQVRNGVLTTDDFKINGSSAAVILSGQVDLNRETQQLRVRVMPTIGDSVSLLAFAAGPMVGAGVFIANKLLSDPLDKLVSFEYNVSGSWIDPKVEKVGQIKASPK